MHNASVATHIKGSHALQPDEQAALAASTHDALTRIDAWLAQNAPRSLTAKRPPAADADLAAAVAAVGAPLPVDLTTFWRHMDGSIIQLGIPGLRLIPPLGFKPYPIALALDSRAVWLQVGRGLLGLTDSGFAALQAERWADPAGTDSEVWLEAWLPIAAFGGDVDVFVDLRAGHRHGLVACFYDDGGVGPPTWPSVAAMLAEIADLLEHGGRDPYRIEVRDGALYWTRWSRR